MNREALTRLAAHLRTIPQEDFDMSDVETCAIGHWQRLTNLPNNASVLNEWKLPYTAAHYICGNQWYNVDNTPSGCADRIQYVLDHGENDLPPIPSSWKDNVQPFHYDPNDTRMWALNDK